MYLWLLEQSVVNGYDTYDSCVVAAENENDARLTHPSGSDKHWGRDEEWPKHPEQVEATLLGYAKDDTEAGVIIASFNAG